MITIRRVEPEELAQLIVDLAVLLATIAIFLIAVTVLWRYS